MKHQMNIWDKEESDYQNHLKEIKERNAKRMKEHEEKLA